MALGILFSTSQIASAAGKFDNFCDIKSGKFNIRITSCTQNLDSSNADGNAPNTPTPNGGGTPKTSHPGFKDFNDKLKANPGPHPQV